MKSLAPTLALTVRSLRVEARAITPYVIRAFLVVCIVFAVWTAQQSSLFISAPGLELFGAIVFINFAFISILGVSQFASVITEEKEENTLGLLKMTSLSALSILLGKSIGRLMTGVMLLLTQLPFAMLAITLGGVSIEQVLLAYALLAAYMLLVYGVSLFASTIFSKSGWAAGGTVVLLIAFHLGPPIFWVWIDHLADERTISRYGELYILTNAAFEWFTEQYIPVALTKVLEIGFTPAEVIGPLAVHLGAALVLVILAWVFFERFTRREVIDVPNRPALLARKSSSPAGRKKPWRLIRNRSGPQPRRLP